MQVIVWLSFALSVLGVIAATCGAVIHYHDVSRRHENHNAIAEAVAHKLHLTGATDHGKIAETVVDHLKPEDFTFKEGQ